jgi:type IV secretory pathway component VirB8
VLAFLSSLYEKNTGYSAINTAKSAISSMCSVVSNRDIDNEKIITRFMRGIFNCQPSLLNYTSTWDVNMVFKYLETLSDNKDLSLLELSQKTAILLMLLSGQRC